MTEDSADQLMMMTRINLLQCMGAYKPRTKKRAALKRMLVELYSFEVWRPDEKPMIPVSVMKVKNERRDPVLAMPE